MGDDDKTQIRIVTKSYALKGLKGLHKDKVYPLKSGFKVGREKDNDLIINEGFVSRYHSIFENGNGELTVSDKGSSNGTALNGKPIKSSLISVGDVLTFDVVEFRVIEMSKVEAEKIDEEPYKDEQVKNVTEQEHTALTAERDSVIIPPTVSADEDSVVELGDNDNNDSDKEIAEESHADNDKTILSIPDEKTVISSAPELPKKIPDNVSVSEETVAIAVDKSAERQKVAPAYSPKQSLPEFKGISPPVVDRTFVLRKQNISVGRSPFNDIILKSESVSTRHAEIVRDEEGWFIRDLGSSNGTFVNDHTIEECEIYSGDIVIFGEVELLFDPQGLMPPPENRIIQGIDGGVDQVNIWMIGGGLLIIGVIAVLLLI